MASASISWEELIKNRKLIPSSLNSARLLEIIRQVREKFPEARIQEEGSGKNWVLVGKGRLLSRPHDSHYACWLDALEVSHGTDH